MLIFGFKNSDPDYRLVLSYIFKHQLNDLKVGSEVKNKKGNATNLFFHCVY